MAPPSFLSSLLSLLLACSSLATLASLSFPSYSRYVPAPRPLCLLVALCGILFLPVFRWPASSSPLPPELFTLFLHILCFLHGIYHHLIYILFSFLKISAFLMFTYFFIACLFQFRLSFHKVIDFCLIVSAVSPFFNVWHIVHVP